MHTKASRPAEPWSTQRDSQKRLPSIFMGFPQGLGGLLEVSDTFYVVAM